MIIKQGSIEAIENRNLKISWNLIGLCNFKCPYCLNQNNKIEIHIFSKSEIKYAVSNLLSLDFNSFEFYLLGGEPTLFPHFNFLVSELLKYDKVKKIIIMTNGSKEIIDFNDSRVITIVSVHPFSFNKIKIKKKENIFFNLLIVPEIFDKIKKKYFSDEIDELTVVRKPPDFIKIYDYTDEQKEWILQNDPNRIKSHYLYSGIWFFENGIIEKQPQYSIMEFNQSKYLHFQNLFCLNNSLSIMPNGTYGYTCNISKRSIQSIYFDKIKYNPYIISCPFEFCNCLGKLNILKTKDKNEAKKYLEFIKNGK